VKRSKVFQSAIIFTVGAVDLVIVIVLVLDCCLAEEIGLKFLNKGILLRSSLLTTDN
jgi:hypothetical protein